MAIAAVAIGLVSGCGGDDDDGLPPPPSPGAVAPSPTPTLELTAEEQQAVDEVRALFDEFMRAYIDLATSGDPPDIDAMQPVIGRLTHPFEGDVMTELVDNYVADMRLEGNIVWEFLGPVEVELVPIESERDPQIELQFCLNATEWTRVSKGTNVIDTEGPQLFETRVHVGTVRATYFDPYSLDQADPRWLISIWDSEASSSC